MIIFRISLKYFLPLYFYFKVELLFKSNLCEDGALLKSTQSRAKEMSARVKSLEVSLSDEFQRIVVLSSHLCLCFYLCAVLFCAVLCSLNYVIL